MAHLLSKHVTHLGEEDYDEVEESSDEDDEPDEDEEADEDEIPGPFSLFHLILLFNFYLILFIFFSLPRANCHS